MKKSRPEKYYYAVESVILISEKRSLKETKHIKMKSLIHTKNFPKKQDCKKW